MGGGGGGEPVSQRPIIVQQSQAWMNKRQRARWEDGILPASDSPNKRREIRRRTRKGNFRKAKTERRATKSKKAPFKRVYSESEEGSKAAGGGGGGRND